MAAHQTPSSLGFSRQEHWCGLPYPSPMHKSKKWKWRCSVVSDSQQPHGLQPTRLLRPWDSPGKSTGVLQPLKSSLTLAAGVNLEFPQMTAYLIQRIIRNPLWSGPMSPSQRHHLYSLFSYSLTPPQSPWWLCVSAVYQESFSLETSVLILQSP